VQVDPIKPVLTAPGSILLKLRCDGPLSNFAFDLNVRRYIKEDDCKKGFILDGRARACMHDIPYRYGR